MNSSSHKRLMKDMNVLKNLKDKTVFASPLEDNMYMWVAIIFGPENTPFAGGTFSLLMIFDNSYPQNPPKLKFLSEMFHPNIYTNGELCMDMLKNRWSPSYDVLGILISVQSLLNDPNVKSPANITAAELYEKDIEEYKLRARKTVEKSWIDIDLNFSK